MIRRIAAVAAVVLIAGCTSFGTSSGSGGGSHPAPAPAHPTLDAEQDITTVASDVHSVVVAIQSVQAGVDILSSGSDVGVADLASFSQLVDQSHGFLNDAEEDLATASSSGPKEWRDALSAMFEGADTLHSSLGTLHDYLSSNDVTKLGKFGTQYQEGITDWNAGVTQLYGGAGKKPPLLTGGQG